jgi:hypothetical protein
MAKVTITLEDTSKDSYSIKVEGIDENGSEPLTNAQFFGLQGYLAIERKKKDFDDSFYDV